MGICASCEATAVASTAKLILPDGRLQEYGCHVRVSQVLRKEPGGLFLCNADDMEFDGYVSAVGPDEVLQLGQIYFALPRSMLRRKLQSEDMAALAVRASSALTKNGAVAVAIERGGAPQRSKRGAVAPVRVVEERRKKKGSSSGGGGGRGRGFASDLTVIPE